jgi:hypothetical protein
MNASSAPCLCALSCAPRSVLISHLTVALRENLGCLAKTRISYLWHGFCFTGVAVYLVLLGYWFETLPDDCDICRVEKDYLT